MNKPWSHSPTPLESPEEKCLSVIREVAQKISRKFWQLLDIFCHFPLFPVNSSHYPYLLVHRKWQGSLLCLGGTISWYFLQFSGFLENALSVTAQRGHFYPKFNICFKRGDKYHTNLQLHCAIEETNSRRTNLYDIFIQSEITRVYSRVLCVETWFVYLCDFVSCKAYWNVLSLAVFYQASTWLHPDMDSFRAHFSSPQTSFLSCWYWVNQGTQYFIITMTCFQW